MKTLIKNIKEIIGIENSETKIKKGHQMNNISCVQEGWIMIENDVIADYGTMEE